MRVRPRLVQVERRAEEVRTPGEAFPDVRRLIVVRHDRLGDLVVSLPAVAALRSTYPRARLGLLVRPHLVPLAAMVEGVDQVLPAHADRRQLRREVASFDADLMVCISRGANIPSVAVRTAVRRRVGSGFRIYSPLFTRTVAERRHAGGRHEVEYALSFAHRAGAVGGIGPRAPHAIDRGGGGRGEGRRRDLGHRRGARPVPAVWRARGEGRAARRVAVVDDRAPL